MKHEILEKNVGLLALCMAVAVSIGGLTQVEALAAGHPGFIVRMLGGFIFLLGMFLMAYNTWRTVSAAKPAEYEAAAQIA